MMFARFRQFKCTEKTFTRIHRVPKCKRERIIKCICHLFQTPLVFFFTHGVEGSKNSVSSWLPYDKRCIKRRPMHRKYKITTNFYTTVGIVNFIQFGSKTQTSASSTRILWISHCFEYLRIIYKIQVYLTYFYCKFKLMLRLSNLELYVDQQLYCKLHIKKT